MRVRFLSILLCPFLLQCQSKQSQVHDASCENTCSQGYVCQNNVCVPGNSFSPPSFVETDSDSDGLVNSVEKLWGTDPELADTDADGIRDSLELILGLNPHEMNNNWAIVEFVDADHDGLNDSLEQFIGLSVADSDTDGDLISDLCEVITGSNPLVFESYPDLSLDQDQDHLPDIFEVFVLGSSPLDVMSVDQEKNDLNYLNTKFLAYDVDSDQDGLSNRLELIWGFDPYVVDSDQNNVADVDENIALIYFYFLQEQYGTRACDADWDHLTDDEEISLFLDPMNSDTDGDYLADGIEWFFKRQPQVFDSFDTLDVQTQDSDGDGISNEYENILGLNSSRADSDFDQYSDSYELASGSNPFEKSIIPNTEDENDNHILDELEDFLTYFSSNVLIEQSSVPKINDYLKDDDIDNLIVFRELMIGTDIALLDSDEDGIADGYEYLLTTDPHEQDTDGDTLSDAYEIWFHSNPLNIDSDYDGINDNLDDLSTLIFVDSDEDGVTDEIELLFDLNMNTEDSDQDGVSDALEIVLAGNATSSDIVPDILLDEDHDNVSDLFELYIQNHDVNE